MDAMVTARVPIEIKNQATKVFESLGITTSQAINDFFKHVAGSGRLPELRSEEQVIFEGRERVFDQQVLTPKMKEMLKAMKAIQDRAPIDWGEDANKSFKELLEEAREERCASLLGY